MPQISRMAHLLVTQTNQCESATALKSIHKQPAGPETVPIKRTFFKKMVILPQCRADLMIGNPGRTWGAFFRFSASSLQRMRRYQLAVSILVNVVNDP